MKTVVAPLEKLFYGNQLALAGGAKGKMPLLFFLKKKIERTMSCCYLVKNY